jgi:large subunit ribosomal protein L24
LCLYLESEKDTREEDLTEITFAPSLKTFEMDIMENMGIKEDRVAAPTYWY